MQLQSALATAGRQITSFCNLQSTQYHYKSLRSYCGQGNSRSNTRVSPTNWPLLSLQAAEARSMVRLEPHDGSISAYYRRYGMPSPLSPVYHSEAFTMAAFHRAHGWKAKQDKRQIKEAVERASRQRGREHIRIGHHTLAHGRTYVCSTEYICMARGSICPP
ncbi:hypothetical protein M440DRAFT_194723 [Trichoderma longibrachiatum ATCC 18648]|uniref:Uncharacterized protein n=1 Tax=Trichoderma longibrachiatum ATCC 18648 TaxID=983965 RepID=A0A2T4CFU9_TRILO|nr:hypothetical protein M440DRAFT_194723 [Trichoderma longibrachiatum ATCC 18648]